MSIKLKVLYKFFPTDLYPSTLSNHSHIHGTSTWYQVLCGARVIQNLIEKLAPVYLQARQNRLAPGYQH